MSSIIFVEVRAYPEVTLYWIRRPIFSDRANFLKMKPLFEISEVKSDPVSRYSLRSGRRRGPKNLTARRVL